MRPKVNRTIAISIMALTLGLAIFLLSEAWVYASGAIDILPRAMTIGFSVMLIGAAVAITALWTRVAYVDWWKLPTDSKD